MARYSVCILIALYTLPVLASEDSRGPNGIEATGLKMPDGTTDLTGAGIPVGHVEERRPPKDGLDSVTLVNSGFRPEEVWLRTSQITTMDQLVADHPTATAGTVVHSEFGIAPDVTLYAGAYETEGIEPGYSHALLTLQRIATRPSGGGEPAITGTRVINNSWFKEINDITTTDGNSLLSLGVDWLASQHDVLLVLIGNEGKNRPVPQDSYNGIVVGASAKEGTKYRRVADFNTFDEDAAGDRTSIHLIAPGENVAATGLGDFVLDDPVPSGTSMAAPHVTGTVALLQQYGDFQSTNVGGPRWDSANPKRHEVMKAVLMNATDKKSGVHGSNRTVVSNDATLNYTWEDSPAFSDPFQPLDIQMGAGHLNARRALTQFKAGEWEPFADVPNIGWDYHETGGEGTIISYPLELEVSGYVAITLAWDRQVTKSGGSANTYDPSNQFSGGINDLDLYLMPKNWSNLGYNLGDENTVAQSLAGDSTVEHIFKSVATGMYEIVVHHFGGIDTDQEYALAWWMGTNTGATVAGDFDNDGDVDGRDLLEWQRGNSPDPLSSTDLGDWQTNYGTTGLTAANTAVPEPSSMVMLSVLATACFVRRWVS